MPRIEKKVENYTDSQYLIEYEFNAYMRRMEDEMRRAGVNLPKRKPVKRIERKPVKKTVWNRFKEWLFR